MKCCFSDAGSDVTAVVPWVSVTGDSLASVSCEGLFDAYCEPDDTGRHPLILTGLPGCPYRMTSYRAEDVADVDPAFGVQLHQPRFLERIGAPESARLYGGSPAKCVQTMNRQDVMVEAMLLQRDVGLMGSNLQVLGQYVMSLNRMSMEVLHLVYGRKFSLRTRSTSRPRVHSEGSHGIVAATDWHGWSRANHGVFLQ